MSLSLDVYNKKKQNSKKTITMLDRRIFKGGRNKEENLIEELKKDMDALNIPNKLAVLKDLLNLKEKLKYLNFYLLLNVYLYFASKNFELSLVFMNFENDFQEEYEKILKDNPYTNDLKNKFTIHKFRQDYIIYLFMLADLNLNHGSETETLITEFEEESYLEDKEYFEGAVDFEDIEDDEYMQDL
jgi:hypothetical protein